MGDLFFGVARDMGCEWNMCIIYIYECNTGFCWMISPTKMRWFFFGKNWKNGAVFEIADPRGAAQFAARNFPRSR